MHVIQKSNLDSDITQNQCTYQLHKSITEQTVAWYRSFLTNRSQRVKIEDSISNLITLSSGVPQGGILSPLLFIIYVADLKDFSGVFNLLGKF